MEKRGERKEGVPVLALAKCLLASYVLTLLLLCLLALLLYKLHLTEGMVTIAISAIYVITTFMAGFLAGKKMKTQKFLWGALLGAAYFVILAVVSVLIKTPETALLLDHNGIVCGRGDTGRNVRVKYRNGQEFNGF